MFSGYISILKMKKACINMSQGGFKLPAFRSMCKFKPHTPQQDDFTTNQQGHFLESYLVDCISFLNA